MDQITEQAGLAALQREKSRFRNHIKLVYEPAAQDCGTCPTMGSCCTDAHFVNVHISRLEAVAMRATLNNANLSDAERRGVYERAAEITQRFGLAEANETFSQTYSCPLFQPGTGCLVHATAKPAPCIHHACYENADDLPPDALLGRAELAVESLNHAVYGGECDWRPIPAWLNAVSPFHARLNDSDGEPVARLRGAPNVTSLTAG